MKYINPIKQTDNFLSATIFKLKQLINNMNFLSKNKTIENQKVFCLSNDITLNRNDEYIKSIILDKNEKIKIQRIELLNCENCILDINGQYSYNNISEKHVFKFQNLWYTNNSSNFMQFYISIKNELNIYKPISINIYYYIENDEGGNE